MYETALAYVVKPRKDMIPQLARITRGGTPIVLALAMLGEGPEWAVLTRPTREILLFSKLLEQYGTVIPHFIFELKVPEEAQQDLREWGRFVNGIFVSPPYFVGSMWTQLLVMETKHVGASHLNPGSDGHPFFFE